MSLTAETARFADNPSYVDYERLLLALHRLYLAGCEHSHEADAIRDGMDEAGELLSRAEIRRLKGISGDLFQIQGREIFIRVTDPARASELLEQMRRALDDGNWEAVLDLLRRRPPDTPDAVVAGLRAEAYEALGDHEAAGEFAAFAAGLEPRARDRAWLDAQLGLAVAA